MSAVLFFNANACVLEKMLPSELRPQTQTAMSANAQIRLRIQV
jgi:hypothetical protein